MLKALRYKLAIAYTLLAGLVLVAVSFAVQYTAESQLEAALLSSFKSGVNAIIYKLQGEAMLSHTWLSQTEVGSRQIISIEENDVPLSFMGAWTPTTARKTLIESALANDEAAALMQPLGSLEPCTVTFSLLGERNEPYLAAVTLLSQADHAIRLVVIKDVKPEHEQMIRQRVIVMLVVCAGLALIIISGWLYSGHAIKPAQISNQKQIEFVSLASHELKAPLAVITASVDAIERHEDDLLLKNIKTESTRMARLVNDLLLLSRADARTWSLQKRAVDMDTVMIECYEAFYPIAKAKKISLLLSLPDERLPRVLGDSERIAQILSILLDNAIAYTPPMGNVQFAVIASDRYLSVTVSDDGQGIAAEFKERVFERFFRVESSHSDKSHAGLGLPIARELMRLHNGRINMEEITPHGTKFVLEFPIDAGR
ncbi:MAG: HAMP domain-containing histidine kinase [Clostridiales bacterium]|nr:HAMP domain-containing histidine kinase [Clostridiales bacterium]